MRRHPFVALFLCVASPLVCAAEEGAWLRSGWQPYAGGLVGSGDAYKEERDHWLRSRLKFSGKTARTSDGIDGTVGVATDRLLGQKDTIGLDYRNNQSYQTDTRSSQMSLRYGFPAGANKVNIEAGKSRYSRAVSNGSGRVEASGEARDLNLTASRPLFSQFGMSFDGVARHRGRDSASFKDDSLISESRHQVSSFGLDAKGGHELMFGFVANTHIQALSGREYRSTDYSMQEGISDERDFYKVAVSGSIEQAVFQWNWRVNGRYQFSDEDLPSSEYLTVAGSSMMAGFNGQSVAAFKGGWLRVGTDSPPWSTPFTQNVLSSINLSVLQGWVPDSGAQAHRHGKASAGQVALKMQGRAFTANVSVGRMISNSNAALTMPDYPDLRFSLSMDI